MERRWFSLFCILAVFYWFANGEKARFDNYRLYELNIDNEKQLDALQQIDSFPDGYLFWESPLVLNEIAEIMVPPHKFGEFSELIGNHNITSKLKIKNIQTLIDREQPALRTKEAFLWRRYHTLDDIYAWIDTKVAEHSNILSNIDIGESHEGRTIRAVKLSHKTENPTIFIESGVHAREWIAPATATYVLNQLLTSKDVELERLAHNYNWIFVIVLNVDGYVYTHTKNRLWRKNRRPSGSCFGVDINRNFDFQFGVSGTSPFPCSDTYKGPFGNSEVETVALTKFISSIPNIKLYLSLHSYGQYLIFPYGYSRNLARNDQDLARIAKKTVDAIHKHYGTVYTPGSIARTLYAAAGSSNDWVFSVRNISLSYCFELRGPPRNPDGFLLPSHQIISTAVEFIDGLKAMMSEAHSLNYL